VPTSNGSAIKTNGINGINHNGNLRVNADYNTGSMISAETDHTYLPSISGTLRTTTAYIENCGSSIASNGGSSQASLINGHSSNGSQSTINAFISDDFEGYYNASSGVLKFDDDSTNLIFQGEIGGVSSLMQMTANCLFLTN
jgi:hypothetical protein